jgi:hypothetical protein
MLQPETSAGCYAFNSSLYARRTRSHHCSDRAVPALGIALPTFAASGEPAGIRNSESIK